MRSHRLASIVMARARGGLGRRSRGAVAGLLTGLRAGLGAGLAAAAGCSSPTPPYAAEQSMVLTAEDERSVARLDGAAQGEVIAAMRDVAPGHRPTRTAVPAPAAEGGVRWSDVEAAAGAACSAIEAAVVGKTGDADADEYRFRIRTIENWPGELVVRRVDPPAMYEATAWIGRFPDERVERRDALLRAFDARLRAFGMKRKYPE